MFSTFAPLSHQFYLSSLGTMDAIVEMGMGDWDYDFGCIKVVQWLKGRRREASPFIENGASAKFMLEGIDSSIDDIECSKALTTSNKKTIRMTLIIHR